MGSEIETIKERLTSLLYQLQVECGILERVVYKNKNQHRRSSYFQYLLKVRRDLKTLQSAKLQELVNSCFLVIIDERPKQKIHLLESLKRRKCDIGQHNFMERLLGAARLLSQMVEPMVKAAIEISILFAQSFFMGFSTMVMALLGRLRVLVQQILLDVVSLFNMVSSLAQKRQSVKIEQEGIEVFREFFPVNVDFVTLECVWKSDKYILLEKMSKRDATSQDGCSERQASPGTSTLKYRILESFLGDGNLDSLSVDANSSTTESSSHVKTDTTNSTVNASLQSDNWKVILDSKEGDEPVIVSPCKEVPQEGSCPATLEPSRGGNAAKSNLGSKKVAFLSVINPAYASAKTAVKNHSAPTNICKALPSLEKKSDNDDKEDSFFNLLTGGIVKDSLF